MAAALSIPMQNFGFFVAIDKLNEKHSSAPQANSPLVLMYSRCISKGEHWRRVAPRLKKWKTCYDSDRSLHICYALPNLKTCPAPWQIIGEWQASIESINSDLFISHQKGFALRYMYMKDPWIMLNH